MTVETATYLASLNSSLPVSGDQIAEGDDHLRLLKTTLKNTFPGRGGAERRAIVKIAGYTPSATEIGSVFVHNGDLTVNLPSAAGLPVGAYYHFKAITGRTILVANGTELIDDMPTFSMEPSEDCLLVKGDANAWMRMGNSGQFTGLRNRIINGAMVISQEFGSNVTSVSAGTSKYAVNNMLLYVTGAATTFQQVQVDNATFGSRLNALQVNGAAGVVGVMLYQRIEATNCRDLAGKPIAVSCRIYQSSGSTMSVVGTVIRPTVTDNYAGIATDVALTFPINSVPSGVWTHVKGYATLTNNAVTGLQVEIQLLGAINSGAVLFTEFQVESGSIATPFERRDIASELVLCQRYYEIGRQNFSWMSPIDGISTAYSEIRFQVRKRVGPTMTLTSFQYYSSGTPVSFTPSGVTSEYDNFHYQGNTLTDWQGWSGSGTWAADARL